MKFLPVCGVLIILPLYAQMGEYGGPAVLSRGGGGGVAPVGGIRIRPFINLSGSYQSGLVAGNLTDTGQLATADAVGGEIAFGVYGYQSWKRTTLGVNYRGDYRKFNRARAYDGSNQLLAFGVTHQPSRHVSVSFRQGAGTYTRMSGYMGTFGFYDPTFAHIPSDELLDSRIYYTTTMGDVTYIRSARLSFNFGGTGFVIRRQASSLYNVNGFSARGDAAYRLSRRSTLAFDYFFTHFNFDRLFGNADMHSIGVNYSVAPSRWWEVAVRAGMLRIETLALGTVEVDPVVAAIIGRSRAFRAFHQLENTPSYSLQVIRRFRRSSAIASVQRGANPGNGVYLTSRQNSVSGTYSYTGMRHWSFSAAARYSDMKSLGLDIGTYKTASAGLGLTRTLTRQNLYLTARWDLYRRLIEGAYRRVYHSAWLGIAWSPGDVPFRLW